MPISSPTDIAGCQFWAHGGAGVYADAGSTPATDGQTVQQWNDQSGAGHDLTQATSGNRPTLQTGEINSRAVVRFDGIDNFMETDTFTLGAVSTVFVAFRWAGSGSGTRALLDCVGSGFGRLVYVDGSGFLSVYAGTAVAGDTAVSAAGVYLMGAVFNGGSSLWEGRDSGGLFDSATGNPGTASASGLTVGSHASGGGSFAEVDVAEVIAYDSALAATPFDDVLDYLAARYVAAAANPTTHRLFAGGAGTAWELR